MEQSILEQKVANLIVTTLNLEMDVTDIQPNDALFGDGLGLDSIDALEIAMSISKEFGFKLRSDDPENKNIFSSLRALTQHIEKSRTK